MFHCVCQTQTLRLISIMAHFTLFWHELTNTVHKTLPLNFHSSVSRDLSQKRYEVLMLVLRCTVNAVPKITHCNPEKNILDYGSSDTFTCI